MGPLVGSFVRLFLRCPGWSRIEDGRLSFGEDQRGFIAFGKPLFWRETMGNHPSDTALTIQACSFGSIEDEPVERDVRVRSEGRREGEACVCTGRSRWTTSH